MSPARRGTLSWWARCVGWSVSPFTAVRCRGGHAGRVGTGSPYATGRWRDASGGLAGNDGMSRRTERASLRSVGQWVSGSVEQWSSGAVKHPWLRDRVGKALVLGK